MEVIIFISVLVNFFLGFFLGLLYFVNNHYGKMVMGTIVGKYKGNLYCGGFVVVEMEVTVDRETQKVSKTYEVPEEYYSVSKLGDKNLFPY